MVIWSEYTTFFISGLFAFCSFKIYSFMYYRMVNFKNSLILRRLDINWLSLLDKPLY